MHILIVDDHAFVCAGLEVTLRQEIPNLEISIAHDGDGALQKLAAENIDLAIVDLFMPGAGGGFQFVEMLCESYPTTPIVVLSGTENPGHVRQCLNFGIGGFVTKSSPRQELFNAISQAMNGQVYVPPSLREGVPDVAQVFDDVDTGANLETISSMLTLRQMDIWQLVTNGRSNKQIARELGVSENTVKVHVSAILRTLGLKNRTQAGLLGQKLGIGLVPRRV